MEHCAVVWFCCFEFSKEKGRGSELERDVPFTCVSAAKPCDVTSASLKPTTLGGAIEEMNISRPSLVARHWDRQDLVICRKNYSKAKSYMLYDQLTNIFLPLWSRNCDCCSDLDDDNSGNNDKTGEDRLGGLVAALVAEEGIWRRNMRKPCWEADCLQWHRFLMTINDYDDHDNRKMVLMY